MKRIATEANSSGMQRDALIKTGLSPCHSQNPLILDILPLSDAFDVLSDAFDVVYHSRCPGIIMRHSQP